MMNNSIDAVLFDTKSLMPYPSINGQMMLEKIKKKFFKKREFPLVWKVVFASVSFAIVATLLLVFGLPKLLENKNQKDLVVGGIDESARNPWCWTLRGDAKAGPSERAEVRVSFGHHDFAKYCFDEKSGGFSSLSTYDPTQKAVLTLTRAAVGESETYNVKTLLRIEDTLGNFLQGEDFGYSLKYDENGLLFNHESYFDSFDSSELPEKSGYLVYHVNFVSADGQPLAISDQDSYYSRHLINFPMLIDDIPIQLNYSFDFTEKITLKIPERKPINV